MNVAFGFVRRFASGGSKARHLKGITQYVQNLLMAKVLIISGKEFSI